MRALQLAGVLMLAAPWAAGTPVASAAAVGGSLMCVLTGLLFGAAVMSGNALAAAGALVAALDHGCI